MLAGRAWASAQRACPHLVMPCPASVQASRSATAARRELTCLFQMLDTRSAWGHEMIDDVFATLRSALTEHGLQHLLCNALIRHVAQSLLPPEHIAKVVQLAVKEGQALGPLVACSSLMQAIRFFPERMARNEALASRGREQAEIAADLDKARAT